METSRSRAAARASSRLATLLHATSSTKPTAPSSNQSVPRTSPTTVSSSEVRSMERCDSRYLGCASASANDTRVRSSSSVKPRPSVGETPSVGRKDAVASTTRRCCGVSRPVSVMSPSVKAATFAKTRGSSRYSWYSTTDEVRPLRPAFAKVFDRSPSRSGSASGGGVRSTPFTTLKTALLAPMPSASARTATTAKPGLLRSERRA